MAYISCFVKKEIKGMPSLKHFGAVAENIAKKPIITKNVTIITRGLSGAVR